MSISPSCSKLPYDVSNDQALEHEPVRQKVAATVKALRDLSDRFQQSIFDSVNKIPYVANCPQLRHGLWKYCVYDCTVICVLIVHHIIMLK